MRAGRYINIYTGRVEAYTNIIIAGAGMVRSSEAQWIEKRSMLCQLQSNSFVYYAYLTGRGIQTRLVLRVLLNAGVVSEVISTSSLQEPQPGIHHQLSHPTRFPSQ